LLLNFSLPSLSGLDNLQSLGEFGTLVVFGNDSLSDLQGLGGLTTVDRLFIEGNFKLKTLAGLENLVTIGDSASISGNDSLLNLEGLAGLQSIGDGLLIMENPMLTSLAGLSSITTIDSTISIIDNAMLETCATTQICEILKTKSVESVVISGNLADCETREAVDLACLQLPVTLISFTAKKEGHSALLEWSTSAETNSDHFEVQHSNAAGEVWSVAGKMAAKGESAVLQRYSFVHENPVAGTNLYRLKMVDKDGTFAYSGIKHIRWDNLVSMELYPNPVVSTLMIRPAGGAVSEVHLYNAFGERVAFKYPAGQSQVMTIQTDRLPAGLYIIRVTHANGTEQIGRFVKK
jgi:hypothetical protein